MSLQIPHNPAMAGSNRDRCYGCFRPRRDCYCASIPTIDNLTEVLILQHMRERFHPFNTARIVHRALANSTLLADHTAQLAARLRLKPRAALLYPGANAQLLTDIPRDELPEQLVILDGTWHHAKTLVRDIPALAALPRFRLAPASPSRYRIRREPSDVALSTVEAIVAALAVLEPETAGVGRLMAAFDLTVERQLAHPKAEYGRRKKSRRRACGNIPFSIVDDLANVVVAYGESAPGTRGDGRTAKPPIYWVAERIGSGERFACAINPPAPLDDAFLGHLELAREVFDGALSLDEARRAWQAFLRPSDTLAVYNQGTARLLEQLSFVDELSPDGFHTAHQLLLLKSTEIPSHRRYGTLDEIVEAEGLVSDSAGRPGRANRRLANAVALARHLNALANVASQLASTADSSRR
ncbi:MAG TPA: tRNA-uridine aminocarboxypropyltransferase [Pirellulales bacterium]